MDTNGLTPLLHSHILVWLPRSHVWVIRNPFIELSIAALYRYKPAWPHITR